MEVLRHLDGLPLAIELVAGQAAGGDADLRQSARDRSGHTMDLHTEVAEVRRTTGSARCAGAAPGPRLLDRAATRSARSCRAMSPFPGRVDLSGVESLAVYTVPGQDPLPLLQRLVDASLVVVDQSLTRYQVSVEGPAFLLDELTTRGELENAEEQVIRWAVETARTIGTELFGPGRGSR